jgi:hypothetical protein
MRRLTPVLLAILALLPAAAPAQPAGGCPAGTRLVRETAKAWHCMPITLPRISPGFFVTEAEVKFAREQVAALQLKKRRYQDQLAALDRMRGGLEVAARDLNDVRHDIVMDNVNHTLNIIAWSVEALVPGPAGQALRAELDVLKGLANTAASAHSQPGSERRYEKAIDAAFNFKNAVLRQSGSMAPPAADALRRTTDTIPKMLRISERFAQPNPDKSNWELLAATTDDVAAAAGEFWSTLKATRSTVHIIGGEVALWHIEQSKGAIDQAFVQSQTAKRYYLQKIAENEQAQEFYRERIRRAEVR